MIIIMKRIYIYIYIHSLVCVHIYIYIYIYGPRADAAVAELAARRRPTLQYV